MAYAYSWTAFIVCVVGIFTELGFNLAAPAQEASVSNSVSGQNFNVIVQGFKAIPSSPAELITSAAATDKQTCIQSCQTDPNCAFVSFDDSSCQSFTKAANPFFDSSAEHTLQGPTRYQFVLHEKQTDPRGNIELDEFLRNTKKAGQFGMMVASQDVCVQLCQIHPQCNSAAATVDHKGFSLCSLKNLPEFNLQPNAKFNFYAKS